MERTCKNINRNRTAYNHITNNTSRNNLMTPEARLNQIWTQDEETNGVKIIELNTSTDSSEEPVPNKFSNAWSFVNNDNFQKLEEDDYRVNQEARRRRRINMEHNKNVSSDYAHIYCNDYSVQSHTNSFFDTYDSEIGNAPMNHQMNCFTIINNQNINTDSSDSEHYDAIEIIELDKSEENKYWENIYSEKVVAYNPNTQSEKRTIWIYSYKNKRLLSDNDFELVNIPSKEMSSTSTSYSTSDEEQRAEKTMNACRVASPIPPTYIPRLDLSLVQTLSTVTEVSEVNRSHSKDSSHESLYSKPRNNWLCDRNDKFKLNKNSNVVNWMALSPRERRRRSINTNSDNTKENITERETTHAEGVKQIDQTSVRSSKINSSTIQVKADIHVSGKDMSRELCDETINNKPETKEIKKIQDIVLPLNISFVDVHSDDDNNAEIDYSNKPSIEINTKLKKNKITDPIEKLNCQNWISEEKVEIETTIYDYELQNAAEFDVEISSTESINLDSASRRLWLKNMQLMKPPQWAEYLPITCSPPSLHLTISLSSINGKQSWFKRLAKCVKCCK